MTHGARRLTLLVALATGVLLVVQGVANGLPAGTPKTGMVCAPKATGTTDTYNLVANTGTMQTPDGNQVFMWSYSLDGAPSYGYPTFQTPGPVLCVTQGQTVHVNLRNTLPEASSIVFPGQQGVTAVGTSGDLTTEATASGGTAQYTFTAGNPGTYLYQSGSDVAKQVEMGLYGALVVRPNAATCAPQPNTDCAYGGSTRFDSKREYLLLLAEIDPVLHHTVELNPTGPYDFNTLHNRYFTINGRSFPDTIQDNGSSLLPKQPYGALVRLQPNTAANTLPVLIRMINAGVANHPFHPHGNHLTQIAQDGRLLAGGGGGSASTERFGETIAAGQTQDYLLRWDDQDSWNPNTNQIPVAQPNYRNLTFKDATTWYSGTPYLGYKGTLPTGTNSLNVCGEWYFPLHSHALDEFTNFDEGFGGMGTLMRVDPPGGCFSFPTSTALIGGVLKSGTITNLGDDVLSSTTTYQVNPKTTTLTSARTSGQTTLLVASASGFPSSGSYYVRVDNEVMQVTGGQGTTTWTVTRGQLLTTAAGHSASAVVSALATDWYAGFTGLPTGTQNLKVTYVGKNCGTTTSSTCTAIASNPPAQTVKICNWTIAGAAGCSTATSSGWVTLPPAGGSGPAQPQNVGSTDVTSTWSLPSGLATAYVGTGSYKGQVRILVHTQRWTSPSPTPFSTWGNLMKLVYDAP
jgi:FtsP/CotA-like multicopper oxidase with cupredoxin domain